MGWHASPSRETSLSEKGKVARHLQALKKAEESAAGKTAPEKSLRLLKPRASLPDCELIRCISQLDPQSPNGLSPGSPGRGPLPSQALTSWESSLTQGLSSSSALPSTTQWLTGPVVSLGILFPPTTILPTHGPCSGQGSSFGAPKLPASVLTGLSVPGHPCALPTFAGRAVDPSAPLVNTPLVAPCCQQIKSPNSLTQPGRLFPASPGPSCPPPPPCVCIQPASSVTPG